MERQIVVNDNAEDMWKERKSRGCQKFWSLSWENPSFANVESLSSLLPCELQRPPGRMKGQTGPFGIEPKEGEEEYKSPSTWNMVLSFLEAKVKRETDFRVGWEVKHAFLPATFVSHQSWECVGEKVQKRCS